MARKDNDSAFESIFGDSFEKNNSLEDSFEKKLGLTKERLPKVLDTTLANKIKEHLKTKSVLVDFSKSLLNVKEFDKNLKIYKDFFDNYAKDIAYYKSPEGKQMSVETFDELKKLFSGMIQKLKLEINRILFFFAIEEYKTQFGVGKIIISRELLSSVSKKLGIETEILQIENLEKEAAKLITNLGNPKLDEESILSITENKSIIEEKIAKLEKSLEKSLNPFHVIMGSNMLRNSIKEDNSFKTKRDKLSFDNAKVIIEAFTEFSNKYSSLPEIESAGELMNTMREIKAPKIEEPNHDSFHPLMGM